MRRVKGFTLIELVIVIVILGILAAIVVPKLSEGRDAAIKAAKEAAISSVRSSWAIAYAKTAGLPKVADVAKGVVDSEGNSAMAANTGVTVKIHNEDFTVLTFKDDNCKEPTVSSDDIVKCVKGPVAVVVPVVSSEAKADGK